VIATEVDMEVSEARNALQRAPVFKGLDEAHLNTLAKAAHERSFSAGSKIVEEGETRGLGFWVILDGTVDVRKGGTTVNTLSAGEHFGEMALLSTLDTPRSADVVARTDVRVLQLTRWDLRALIKDEPDIALAMMNAMMERLRETGGG
jgi:CRP/FNR family cyclic AMP-dependent transcriptional regulator